MTTIKVPVINESPNTITVTFPSEFAVSFEAANPDGIPSHCQVGGPGVLGGPEFINMLQRGNTVNGQNGYAVETFQLAAYPNHTFYSFKNFTTGAKNVVAFNTATATTAAIPTGMSGGTGAIAGATFGASGVTGVTKTFTTTAPDVKSFTWGGTKIGTILSGQGTTAMVFTPTLGAPGSTGTITMTVVNDLGNTVVTTQTWTTN